MVRHQEAGGEHGQAEDGSCCRGQVHGPPLVEDKEVGEGEGG